MMDGFGARIKELRQRAGLTQQGLAQAAGLSVSGIARLEQGGSPAPQTVTALERALDVPTGALRPPTTEDGPNPEGEQEADGGPLPTASV